MRKKDILGNFVTNPGVLFDYEIKQVGERDYAALVTFLPGTRELHNTCNFQEICLAAPGYQWLEYLHLDEYWKLCTFYNAAGSLFEWYFDISRGNFLDERQMPCINDLWLDLVILPSGTAVTLDADELRDALSQNLINQGDYDHAYKIHNEIKNSKWSDVEFLTKFSNELLAKFK